ncbi:MAG: carboxypeptidase-like regulatory domain-containing protein, partial [Eudoraea sp.]|nr:carboxypeptidase-like regulatory domain-containing protein [Eudoraea sp.]
FDVSRSFVARGNPNKEEFNGFNFKPVIKASNLTTSGSLAGNVFTTLEDETQEALEGAQVALYIADTLNTTTFSNEDGSYMVMGLEAGSYTVEVQLDTYETQTVEGVSIIAGNKTIQDFELVPVPEP